MLGDPLGQPHERRAEQTRLIHERRDFLQRPRADLPRFQRRAVAQQRAIAAAQRNVDATADFDFAAQPVGHQIVQRLRRPTGKGDRGDQPLGCVVGLPGRRVAVEEALLLGGISKADSPT